MSATPSSSAGVDSIHHMRQERWSAADYRSKLGLAPGVVVPASPKVRSSIVTMTKPERAYAHYLEYEKLAGRIVAWWPQPFALRLPGWRNSYRPDFLIDYGLGSRMEVVEIKALWRNGKVGYRGDARVKVKTAAGIFPCFNFVVRWKDSDIWECEVLS